MYDHTDDLYTQLCHSYPSLIQFFDECWEAGDIDRAIDYVFQ